MKILTPSGFECLNSIIKLTNIPSCRLVFEDGNTLECAEEHILIQDNDDEYVLLHTLKYFHPQKHVSLTGKPHLIS